MNPYRIFGDWGTTRLRLFHVDDTGARESREGPGIAMLDRPAEAVLRDALAPWLAQRPPTSIALCGMVGSRNGWVEVPYVECPADTATWLAGAHHATMDGIPVTIMAGLATPPSHRPDMMRGEETQAFGALRLEPALATGRHLVALPGTHSKWITLDEGRIIDVRTFLTGETFALLRDHSMLARVMAGDDAAQEDNAGFADGLARAREGRLLGALFEARSAQLRCGRSPAWARDYLSGLLIGAELFELLSDRTDDASVTLIGAPALTDLYRRALDSHDVAARALDGDACALAGLMLRDEHL